MGKKFNKQVVDYVMDLLRVSSKESPITCKQLCGKVVDRYGTDVTPAKMRSIIHRIRCDSVIPLVLASGEGYYVSDDIQDITDYIGSLGERIAQIAEVRYSIIRQYRDMITGELFTEEAESRHG